MAEPRPISGSIGSRVRVVLGASGSDYLLLANYDNGVLEWQTRHSNGIPGGIEKQLKNCAKKYRHATQADFGPGGEWFVLGQKHDGSGAYCWWGGSIYGHTIGAQVDEVGLAKVSFGRRNGSDSFVSITGTTRCTYANIDEDLKNRIIRLSTERKAINFVRLFDNGAYFISDDDGTDWGGLGINLSNELTNGSGTICDVAVAQNGDSVVIREGRFELSDGICEDLIIELSTFYSRQTSYQQVREREIQEYRRAVRDAHIRAQLELDDEETVDSFVMLRAEQVMREREQRERFEQRRLRLRRKRKEEERQRRNREHAERIERERQEEQLYQDLLTTCRDQIESIKLLETQAADRKSSVEYSLSVLSFEKRQQIYRECDFVPRESASDANSRTKCVICQEEEANMAIVPCGHVCLCQSCAPMVAGTSCPLCRARVQIILKIYNQS